VNTKRSRTKTLLPLAGVAIVCLVSTVPASAGTIASTDFNGRTLTTTTVANDTATNLNWSLNGVADPGNMAAKNAGGGGQVIFDGTATVQSIFAPGLNTGNGNTFWTTDVSLTPAAGFDVTLTDVTFNYWAISSAQVENVNRRSDFTATLFNPSAIQVDSVTVADVLGGNGGGGQPLVTLTFASPIALTDPGTYTLQIKGGDFTGFNETGNHTAIDNLSINGVVSSGPARVAIPLIVGTGPGYVHNGSFESGTGTNPDEWGTGLDVGGEQRLDTLTATDGSYSLVVAATLGGLINTGYNVQADDTFDLSFDWRSAYNWDAADQIDWRLLTTSDDTTGGGVHVIASGFVTGYSDGIYRNESLTGIGTLTPADLGRDLWLEFYSSNAGTEYARVDQVNLTVNQVIPEPATMALLGLAAAGLGGYVRRRRS